MSDTNEREEFEKWFCTRRVKVREVVWQAATEDSDARYQARVRELEEFVGSLDAMRLHLDQVHKAQELLSTTTPDTALQKALLEARIDEVDTFHNRDIESDCEYLKELRDQLAALEV